jgi:hydrogenase expression/formation protein HypE
MLDSMTGRLAMTTDSYVVRPLFFPGGDIGTLAVNGTINDLAMCGARPRYLSCGFIIEEGFPMETLWRVVRSMASASAEAGVSIVTGDTKVVDRGKGDGVYINTTGIGEIAEGLRLAPSQIRPGDRILVSGDLGRHGMAIMAQREGLAFETSIESDCASLVDLVFTLVDAGIQLRCMRDLTRGGLAAALVEIAEASRCRLQISEAILPVHEQVRAACELLGLEPMHVANEGRFAAVVAAEDAERALQLMRDHALGTAATMIGEVVSVGRGEVAMISRIGVTRIVEPPSGEQLPRIC